MRKILILFILVSTVAFYSCDDEDVKPEGHFYYKGNKYKLEYGAIDDKGTNSEITYRQYAVELKSTLTDLPANYLKFAIYSTSTSRLEEGVYEYAYIPTVGEFSYVEFGYDIEYDEGGVAIEGFRISESNATITGTLTITQVDGDYKFVFDMSVLYQDNIGILTGEFNDVLHDEYVSIY